MLGLFASFAAAASAAGRGHAAPTLAAAEVLAPGEGFGTGAEPTRAALVVRGHTAAVERIAKYKFGLHGPRRAGGRGGKFTQYSSAAKGGRTADHADEKEWPVGSRFGRLCKALGVHLVRCGNDSDRTHFCS